MGAVDMGNLVEEVYINEGPENGSAPSSCSIIRSFLTRNRVPGSTDLPHGKLADPADQPAQADDGIDHQAARLHGRQAHRPSGAA
jgi:hypothetical protein